MPLDLQPVDEKQPLDLQPVEPLDLQPIETPRPETTISAARPQSWLKRAGHALRESLTPLIGPTREQVLNEGVPVYDSAGNLVDVRFRPMGGKVEEEGFFPAASHPMVPLPTAPELDELLAKSPYLAAGALGAMGGSPERYAQAAAIYNTAKGFAEFGESPLGLVTGGAGAAARVLERTVAGGKAPALLTRTTAGAYTADIARQVPEAAQQAGTLSVTGTPQQRYEANLALAATVGLPGALGRETLRPARVLPEIPKAKLQPTLPVSEFGGEEIILKEPLDLRPIEEKGVSDATQEGQQPSNVPVQPQSGAEGGQTPGASAGDRLQPATAQPGAEGDATVAAPAAAELLEPATTTTLAERRLYPVVEVPLSELSLSQDVPNFKAEADVQTGVVAGQQLEGRYERLGTGAITVWERADGRQEVISGRHRFDLAKRTGETTIPAQIVREADGFTRDMAMTLDAEMNIRDGQGSTGDYATYFRNTEITETEARTRGLLSRAKGQAGWSLGKAAGDDLYALYRAGKINEGQAVAIAQAAPGEPALQRVGTRQAFKGAHPQELHNFIQAVRYKTKALPPEQLDLFGADDAAMNEAERLAKIATELQRELDKEIKATDNAARNAEAAKAKGIKFERSPDELLRENALLRVRRNEWDNWALKPELVARVLEKAGSKDVAPTRNLELHETATAARLDALARRVHGKSYADLEAWQQQAIRQAVEARGEVQGRQQSDATAGGDPAAAGSPTGPPTPAPAAGTTSPVLSAAAQAVAELRRQWDRARDPQTKALLRESIGQLWKDLRTDALKVIIDALRVRQQTVSPHAVEALNKARRPDGELDRKAFSALPAQDLNAVFGLEQLRSDEARARQELASLTSVIYPGAEAGVLRRLERLTGLAEVDSVEGFLQKAIAATDPLKGTIYEGVTSAPIWLSKTLAHAALQAVLAAYRAGKQLKAAIEDGIAWLRGQGIPGFDEQTARDWLSSAVNVRQFGEKFHDDAGLSPEVRAGVTQYFYDRRPHAALKSTAAAFVQERGLENAQAVYHDGRALLPDERVALGAELEKQLASAERQATARGNTILAEELVQHQIAIADQAMTASTETAQALAAHHLYGRLSPSAAVGHARKTFDEAAGQQWENTKPTIDNLKREVLQQGNQEALQATIEDPAVNAAAKAAVNQAVIESAQTRKAVILELTELWSQVPSVVDAARAQVRAKAEQLLNTQARPAGFTAPQFLRGILDDLATRAATIAGGHYQGAEPNVPLKDKFVQRLGLSEDAALRLARGMDKEFVKQMEEARKKVSKRIATQRARQTRQVQQKQQDYISQSRSVPDREAESAAKRLMAAASVSDRNQKPAIQEFYQRLTDNLRRLLPDTSAAKAKPLTDLQRLTEALSNAEHYAEVWRRLAIEIRASHGIEGVREIDEILGALTPEGMLSALPVEGALRAQLREMNVKLGDLVRLSAKEVDKEGRTIGQRVVEASGLKGEAAEKLQAVFDRRFRELVTERKRALLQQWEARGNRLPAKLRSAFEQLIQMTNLGAFDDAKFDQFVRQKLGLPTLTPELKADIVRRANAIQTMPEDSLQRQRAAIELMNFIELKKGVSYGSRGLAFWLTNILSGFTTHAINVISTGVNSVYHLGLLAALNPRSVPQIVRALGRGVPKGGLEAGEILRSGILTGSRSLKIEAGRPLELLDPQLRALNPLRLWKYNFRLMAAEDLMLFKPIEEARAAVLARHVAKREGLSGPALQQRVADIMGGLETKVAAAKRQAQSEGMSGLNYQRRWRQIVEQQRPPELREDAREYALRVTFNNHPYGMLGAIARGFNLARGQAPVLNLVQPFVNTVANVFSEQLNNHPLSGLWRAVRGLQRGELYGRRISADRQELHEQYAKTVLATAGLSALAAYFAGNEGDPDKPQLHGGGPRTKAQRDQLRETGWLPYSMQFGRTYIPYEASPNAFGLAVLGDYLDAKRYRNLEDTDLMNRVAVILKSHGKLATKQSFISGLYNLMESLSNEDTKTAGDKLAQGLARTGTSFVVPNLLRQVDRLFDPTVYEASGMMGTLAAQTPFVRREGRPAINVLGEPVEKYLGERFWSKRQPDDLWAAIAYQGAWIPTPDREQIVGDRRRGPDYYRVLTDDEYYEFIQESGQRIRERLDPERISVLEPEQAKLYVQKIAKEEHERAKKLFR